MTAIPTAPRMATTPGIPVRRYSDQAVTVAKLLTASGHTPDNIVFGTLRVIANRCPDLSFRDFVSGAALALTMAEGSERGHS